MARNKHNTPRHYQVSLLADDVPESGGVLRLRQLWYAPKEIMERSICIDGDIGTLKKLKRSQNDDK